MPQVIMDPLASSGAHRVSIDLSLANAGRVVAGSETFAAVRAGNAGGIDGDGEGIERAASRQAGEGALPSLHAAHDTPRNL